VSQLLRRYTHGGEVGDDTVVDLVYGLDDLITRERSASRQMAAEPQ
jgi:hypothetical protein